MTMKNIKTVLAIVAVGIGVALTYHVFENMVHGGIDLIWYDWFNTDENRLLVIPLAIILSLLYFGSQHYFDPKSENSEEHGLGQMPKPTWNSYIKVLVIGLFSLLAGASLGPEAVLVPACMILGALIGVKVSNDRQVVKLLTAAGFMALFTAFFNSFLVGVLSVALVTKQAKIKLNPTLFITAVISSLASYATLVLLSGEAFITLPHYNWHINFVTIIFSIVLAFAGYAMINVMDYVHKLLMKVQKSISKKSWQIHALIAATGISTLYLLGGHLVEFTGNRSIVPMFNKAASLGLIGLIWILIIKVMAISWSKALGYRGGMIFPTIFLATILIAIVQLYIKEFNMIYGIIAVLIGAFSANGKTHILV